MKIDKIQADIDETDYWDSQLLDFTIRYCGDEAEIIFENNDNMVYVITFFYCKNVEYTTDASNRWNNLKVREMNRLQMPYYVQDISVLEDMNECFFEFQLNIYPIYIRIVCKNIKIDKKIYEGATSF